MNRIEMLEQIAGGSCDGIRCAECPVKPHECGGCADCLGHEYQARAFHLPSYVRAHARSLLASDKRIADLEREKDEYREALERIGDMMGKAVDDSKNLYLAVTTAKSAITRQRRKLAEAKDEVIETAKRRYDALTNKPTDALGFAVYRLREAEKEVGE